MVELYPHQESLVDAARAALTRTRAVLMQLPTGGGKTACAVYMIAGAARKGKRSWFIVPRRELLRQTAMTMDDFDIPYSYIAAGARHNPDCLTQIVSQQTVVNRLSWAKAPELAIIDEAHICGDGLEKIIDWLKAAGTYIVGLSATPWRLDGFGLGAYYGDMVCGPSVRWLIDNKYLSDYRAFAPSSPDLSAVGKSQGDYAKGQLADFMEHDRVIVGDAVRHYKNLAMGRLNLAFCVSIKHSQMTAEKFREGGVPAAHIDGTMDDAERRRIITAFGRREVLTLCNVDLLTYGFDLAAQCGFDVTVESMNDLRPTKSLALERQKIGRILRRKAYPAILMDHVNNFREHGFPDDPVKWTLEDRPMGTGGGNTEQTVRAAQCSECFFVFKPAPVCPNCGFVRVVKSREVKNVDGELAEIDRDRERKEDRMEQGKARDEASLVKLFIAKGSSPRNAIIRARHVLKARSN